MSAELPEGVTEADLEEIAEECETMLDVQRELRIGRMETRSVLSRHDLKDEVWSATLAEVSKL